MYEAVIVVLDFAEFQEIQTGCKKFDNLKQTIDFV